MASNQLMILLRKEFDERVQKAVSINKEGLTACDLWTGTTCPAWETVEKGHGKLQTDTAKALGLNYAHHISMFLNDPDEWHRRDGRGLCHRCDVPHCVNREHLYWGSQKENMADREAAGRTRGAVNKSGIENTNAKMMPEVFEYILSHPAEQIKDIAERFELDRHTISRALNGNTSYLTSEQRDDIYQSRQLAKVNMDIVADINAGMTDVDIAAKYSIHRKLVPVIKQRAIDMGIDIIDHETVLTEKIIKAIADGISLVKIAKDLNISRSYINTLKAKAGLKPKFARPDCKGKKKT